MKLEVQWLAYLATQAGVLDSAKCLVLKHALGPETDALEFGEKLIDRGYCTDVDTLQNLIEGAYEKSESGEVVPNNPFEILQSASRRTFGRKNTDIASLTAEKNPPNETFKTISLRTNSANSLSHSSFHRNSTNPTINSDTSPEESEFSTRGPAETPIKLPLKNGPTPPADHYHQSQVQPVPAPNRQEAVPQQAVFEHSIPAASSEPILSKMRPKISLDVEKEWPDFEDVETMSEQEVRQCMVQLLTMSQHAGASDLHICADARPFIRVNRAVEYLSDHILTPKDAEKLNRSLLSEFQSHHFDKEHDLDYSLSFSLRMRYRVNLMEHKDGTSGTYRLVPDEIRTLEELGFSQAENIRKLLTYHNGLIMVTGPLGSGKTATLAALIDELNRTRQDHLITVESPIEIVQHSEECQITQREVGSHTKTFHSALKGALRQDPDIIVIGEMRDLETVEMAISASETGHLVIGTMHTSDAANTLNRLLDVFPAAQQTQIRSMVAESLKGIICQRLLPSTDGGVALAYELLLNNAAVGNLIRTNKADGLSNVIETGSRQGMILMDKSIFSLWQENRISDETALANLISLPLKEQVRSGERIQIEV